MPGEVLDALSVESVSDQVYQRLIEAILNGDLAPGTGLRQETLSRQLGVSRTPLREAIIRLAADGFVELEVNRGAVVAEANLADWQHHWIARQEVESAASRLAAGRIDSNGAEALRAAAQRQRQADAGVAEALAANRDFHLAVAEASGNPYLLRVTGMLWRIQAALSYFGRQYGGPVDTQRWADEHDAIVDAIAARDGDLAARLMREHIGRNPPQEHRQR